MKTDKEQRIAELAKLIEACNEGYWERSQNVISDPEYDRLVEELRDLDPDHRLVQGIGTDIVPGTKVKHKKHMFSLDKCYSWSDLIRFCESVARSEDELFCLSCKYDGLSLEVADGRLITRGNGDVGTDITHLAPWIKCRLSWDAGVVEAMMPSMLKPHKNGTFGRMVGELLVPLDRFEELKNSYPAFSEYKTPRNLASGFAYLKPDSELLGTLKWAGDRTVPVCTWVNHRAHELIYPLKVLRDKEAEVIKKLRNYKKCPCDGIVCRLEDEVYGESLGVTKHHPKSAIALKFKDDEYTSIVRAIEWSVGNEAITPVAIFDPIDVDGVTVERATCHNAKFVLDNNLTPGAEVTIVRKGGVIPKVVAVAPAKSHEKPELPVICPSCGQPTVYEAPDLLCINQTCVGRCTNKIFNGVRTLGMNGVGPSLIERLVRELHIADIVQFFMEAWDQEILLKKGFTAHEIHMLMSETERVTTVGVDDAVIFASLCIPMASETFAQKVIKYTGNIMSLVESLADNSPEAAIKQFCEIPGINSTAVKNTFDYLMIDESGAFEAYFNMFNRNTPIDVDSRTKYCFTGALPFPRKELEEFVLDHGAYPTDNIHQANYLVSASPTSTSSKMKYARSHNIPVITFDEMQAQLSK